VLYKPVGVLGRVLAWAGGRSCSPPRCRARSSAWSRRRSTVGPPRAPARYPASGPGTRTT